MKTWLRRIRGAVGMGLTWAVGWALVGVLIGVSIEFLGLPLGWFIEVFDAPLPALAVPGFFAVRPFRPCSESRGAAAGSTSSHFRDSRLGARRVVCC